MTLTRLRHWIFLSLVFLVPLVLNPWGVDIYEIPKNAVFKLGVGLLGILWTLDALRKKRLEVFISRKVAIFILFFVGILMLSWVTSVRPEVSFLGSYYKQGGLVNMIYYLLFFVLACDFLHTKENRVLFLRVLSWSGCAVSVYALVQKMGFDFLPVEISDFFEGRSFSTLGNPSMLGTFLLFPIGAELALFKKSRRTGAFFSLGLMLLALLASRARASILGLLVMGLFLLFKKYKARKKTLAVLLGVGLVSFGIFAGVYGSNTRSLESRFSLWESSVQMIEARPILGYGLENFAVVFPSYVTAEFYQHEDYMALADRPHNEFLEWWIHLGALGALSYLGLVFFVLRKCWREKDSMQSFVAASLLAVFVSNFFGFSLVTHFVFLTLFLAMLYVGAPKQFLLSKGRALVVAGFGVLLLVSLSFPVRLLVADLLFKKADNAFLSGEVETAYELVRKGQRWNPFFSELYNLSFKIDFGAALQGENLTYLEAAALDNEKAYALDHGSLKTMTNFVHLYTVHGRFEEAEQVLLDLEKSARVQPLVNQIAGEFYYQQGRYEEAVVQYEKLLALLPDGWETDRIFWKNHPEFTVILEHLEEARRMFDGALLDN